MKSWAVIILIFPASIILCGIVMALAAKFFLWMAKRTEKVIAEAREKRRANYFGKIGVRPFKQTRHPHRQIGIDPFDSRN